MFSFSGAKVRRFSYTHQISQQKTTKNFPFIDIYQKHNPSAKAKILGMGFCEFLEINENLHNFLKIVSKCQIKILVFPCRSQTFKQRVYRYLLTPEL